MPTAASLFEPAVFFASSCSLLFVIGCAVVLRLERSEAARALISASVILLLLLGPLVLHVLTGLNTARPWFAWYYVATLTLSGVIELWRLAVVVRIQRGARRSRRPGP
jgi:hypothetical protein